MSEKSPDIPGAFLSDSTEANKEVAPHGSDPVSLADFSPYVKFNSVVRITLLQRSSGTRSLA
jgi:hypothetical protein